MLERQVFENGMLREIICEAGDIVRVSEESPFYFGIPTMVRVIVVAGPRAGHQMRIEARSLKKLSPLEFLATALID